MKVCLTANSGGHLNQLLQLKFLFNDKRFQCFFVTDENLFSQELSKKHSVYYVEKFVFKEIIKKKQIFKPVKNIIQSFKILFKERPNIIITTGAGTSFGSWLWGKIFAKTIFIESIARTSEPSTFGKVFGSKSDVVFVQWENMLSHYKNSIYGGLIFSFNDIQFNKGKKINNIFITVGTYKLQFDRLLQEIDQLLKTKTIGCNVIAQIGASTYEPENYQYFDYCGQQKLHQLISESDVVICQGGSGSIMDSLLRGKKVISIPRLPAFNEFFDEHQMQLVGELEKQGLIIAVYDIKNLAGAIKQAENLNPNLKDMNHSKYYEHLMRLILSY